MFCPQCGARADDDAAFCSSCGTGLAAARAQLGGPGESSPESTPESGTGRLQPTTPVETPATATGSPGPPSRPPWFLPAIIAACVLIAAGIGIAVWRLAFTGEGGVVITSPSPVASESANSSPGTDDSPSATPPPSPTESSSSPMPTAASRLYPVVIDGLTGYIDANGSLVLPAVYQWGDDFAEGLAVVDPGGQQGLSFIDTSGNFVISGLYYAAGFSDGLSAFGSDEGGQQGYIDATGDVVIPQQYANASSFSEGLGAVQMGRKWGFVDHSGAVVLPARWDWADEFHEGLCWVSVGTKYGYIDSSGTVVIPLVYGNCGRFSDGLAPVQIGQRWGYIDSQGNVVIPATFYLAWEFSEGLAPAAKRDGDVISWGYIDNSGAWVLQPQWDDARAFKDGLARVYAGDLVAYIDKSGAYVWEPQD